MGLDVARPLGSVHGDERQMMNRQPVRCPWVDQSKPDYVAYHDEEWGVPVHDNGKLFELLTLEAA
jgi:DNA-3-methyladenine glycosylase I